MNTESELLFRFINKLPDFLRTDGPRMYYANSESTHWAIQSNFNIFNALAVAGSDPECPDGEHIRETARKLLRYGLESHISRGGCAADGHSWGRTWISELGLERMAPGVEAIRPYLNGEENDMLRTVLLDEADWLLDYYPIESGLSGSSGKNKPESNIWNGAGLVRSAVFYPDAPRASEYLEKGRRFLLNGISLPSDSVSRDVFGAKTVGEQWKGANFYESFALDHHNYLNIGYMVICLSNLALLDLTLPEGKNPVREECRRHVAGLWNLVKNCTFPDGRLMRIGGDSRIRYTYCQLYAIPAWFWLALRFGDADALRLEENYLKVMKREMDDAGDGSFFGKRLAGIRDLSYYYYTRLESDAAAVLAHAAWFRRTRNFPAASPENIKTDSVWQWQEPAEGAAVIRTDRTVRSWVQHACPEPSGLCQCLSDSSFAEWGSMHGKIETLSGPCGKTAADAKVVSFEGGFCVFSTSRWVDEYPKGEGEMPAPYAAHASAVAALPDGDTMVVLEYAETLREITLSSIRGMSVLIPNDVFNGGIRTLESGGKKLTLQALPERDEVIDLASDRISFGPGKTSLLGVYGGTFWRLIRRKNRNCFETNPFKPRHPSLYAEEFAFFINSAPGRVRKGVRLLDCGAVFSAQGTRVNAERLDAPDVVRAVKIAAADGKNYLFRANFGENTVRWNGDILAPRTALLSEIL